MTRIVIQVICMALLLQSCSPGFGKLEAAQSQGQARKQVAMTKNQDVAAVRQRVKNFLISWLIQRDDKKAIQFFSEQAFSNEVLFHESCAGYIKDEARKSKEAVRRGVEKFLADFYASAKPKTLSEALGVQQVITMAQQLKDKVVNNVNADRFLLIYLRPEEVRSLTEKPEAALFLKEHLPSQGFYVSFVSVGQGTSFFFWIKEGETWRIFHAALICI